MHNFREFYHTIDIAAWTNSCSAAGAYCFVCPVRLLVGSEASTTVSRRSRSCRLSCYILWLGTYFRMGADIVVKIQLDA